MDGDEQHGGDGGVDGVTVIVRVRQIATADVVVVGGSSRDPNPPSLFVHAHVPSPSHALRGLPWLPPAPARIKILYQLGPARQRG